VIRVTADTNIFISALVFPRGKPFQLLQLARASKISLTVSEAILDEIGGVLARKFGWPPEDIADARKWITEIARTATPALRLDVIQEMRRITGFWNARPRPDRITLFRVIMIYCVWGDTTASRFCACPIFSISLAGKFHWRRSQWAAGQMLKLLVHSCEFVSLNRAHLPDQRPCG
jgi:hypothetical protein